MPQSEASSPHLRPENSLLSLPSEIRNHVYEALLTVDCAIYANDLENCLWHEPSPIPVAILRTCKQVKNEGCAVLYGRNTFRIGPPQESFLWVSKLGAANVELLSCVHIDRFFEDDRRHENDRDAWARVLRFLACSATGLRQLCVSWPGGQAGKDVLFLRQLTGFRNLRSVVIDGCYPPRWPGFLSEKLGVQVREKSGNEYYSYPLKEYQEQTKDLVP